MWSLWQLLCAVAKLADRKIQFFRLQCWLWGRTFFIPDSLQELFQPYSSGSITIPPHWRSHFFRFEKASKNDLAFAVSVLVKVGNWTLEGWWLWESHALQSSHPASHVNMPVRTGWKGVWVIWRHYCWFISVCVGGGRCCWSGQTPSEAVRWEEGKLLSTDTWREEVLSAVAGLCLWASESWTQPRSKFVDFFRGVRIIKSQSDHQTVHWT